MYTAYLRYLLLLVWLCPALLAAQPLPANQEVSVQMIFNEKNAWRSSAGFVNDILVAQDGKFWVASNNNITSWDGHNKIVYDNNKGNPCQLQGDRVLSIHELTNGDLILHTQQEELQIEVLKKNTLASKLVALDQNGTTPKGYLADIINTESDKFFVAYNEGTRIAIYGLDKTYLKPIYTFEFNSNISQNQLKIAYHEQTLWLAVMNQGVWKWQGENYTQVMDFTDLSTDKELNPHTFFSDPNGRLWLGLKGLQDNIFLWNGSAFERFATPLQHPVERMESDPLGQLLFVTGIYPMPLKEVFVLKDTNWLNYSSHIDSTVMTVRATDDLSKSFFAYSKDNIAKVNLKSQTIKRYLHQNLEKGQWGNIIMGINEDLQGNIYFLEETKFHKLEKKTGAVVQIPVVDAQGKEVTFKCGGAVHRDTSGNIWFKVCDGKAAGILVCYQPTSGQFSFYHHHELFRDIDIDNKGQIWVTHHSKEDKLGKLSRFDLDRKQFVPIDLQESFAEPRFCYAANDTTLWIGTVKGLVRVQPERKELTVFTTENSQLQSDHIITLARGPDQWLMTGTYGNGLQFFAPDQNKTLLFNDQHGLTDNYVCGILPIGNQRYWLSTFDGISMFDFSDQTFVNFNVENGLSHHEFNRFSFYQASDATNYLGSVNGVNAFKTDELAPQDTSGRIYLSRLKKYYGKDDSTEVTTFGLEHLKSIFLAPSLTYIELNFYSSNFIDFGPANLYTRLINYDDEWTYAADQSVRYRRLPPGRYTLQVKSQHSSNILELELISLAPFHKTWWFNLLVLGAISGGLILLYRYRVKKLKAEESARIEINRKFAELELQALQAQLNPHFVFNALGAIQHTMRSNNKDKAEYFLTSFAMLMRLFLESSKKKNITLEEEIELITRYVELERLRFEDSFDFNFEVDEAIDIHNTEIPALLFQPFIENAINHGLFHKKEQGLLSIRIDERDDILYCVIQDNGVGRKKAAEIRRKSLRKYPSRSTQIVNERLEILRKIEGLNLNISIEDLEEGGTKVLINIPLSDD